jgi:hypothetical protein
MAGFAQIGAKTVVSGAAYERQVTASAVIDEQEATHMHRTSRGER